MSDDHQRIPPIVCETCLQLVTIEQTWHNNSRRSVLALLRCHVVRLAELMFDDLQQPSMTLAQVSLFDDVRLIEYRGVLAQRALEDLRLVDAIDVVLASNDPSHKLCDAQYLEYCEREGARWLEIAAHLERARRGTN